MTDPRKGPRRVGQKPSGMTMISVRVWPDTIAALDVYAYEHNLFRSGAAHVLIRQALGLPPITTDTES